MEPNETNLVERIHMTNEEFTTLERSVLIHDHVKRYAAIRRFCYGNVLDIASGCGYGTSMISTNPEVRTVLGVDTDEGAIAWGKKEVSNEKISYESKTRAGGARQIRHVGVFGDN